MSRRFLAKLTCLGLLVIICILSGCSSSTSTSNPAQNDNIAVQIPTHKNDAQALFKDVAAEAGLSFRHILGATGKFYFIEFAAPGCAFIDYDADGQQDIFLVQSGSSEPTATVKSRPNCALYHNNGEGTFTDVTAGSGFDTDLGYGQGVAVADYDNDGFDDVFLTSYSGNHLLHNLKGSGQFEDVTKLLGLAPLHGTGFAISAAWGDYDNDGRLDLYVCYYAMWTHATDKKCRDAVTGLLDYCKPQLYEAMTDRLYHNTPSGFVDVSKKAGIEKSKGRSLAVAWTDYNRDGKLDIFEANDATPGILWRNNGNGTFTDVATQTGVAFDNQGENIAGMGVAIADYDHSGEPSIYVSNFSSRPNVLFKNNGGTFEDVTALAGLSFSHLKFLTFGCEFFDYDADSWPDIIINNGHVQMRENKREAGVSQKQRKQLLHNQGNGVFDEISDPALLSDLAVPTAGRGLATGDYDNDGALDILAMSQNAPAQLFRNQKRSDNHWVSFHTIGTKSNRNGIGARLELESTNAKQSASVRGGSSYLSSSDRRVYFGLGKADVVEQVTIIWPSGQREVLKNLPANTFYTLTEGRGITARRKP